nr:MAG: ORF1 [TTV-like mini virus]UGV39579.1 MAG: ORF1 [TTV-like mini virus]UGV42463.1 MAG: ORF1 [TTV-like mini virus]
MAYYWRTWRKPWWKRRRRRFWRRRARTFVRRRRHRRYRVRRKLKTLTLKEWQPSVIRKLCIKGMYCLFQANHKRLHHNWAQYEASIVPDGLPSGGGFSLLRFNLDSLFEQNQLARNIWTKSNKYLPIIRYTGCTFKIYRPENVDVVIKFQNCHPMTASQLLYTGCQPSILMMSRGSKKIPCKKTNARYKPYKKYRFPPPQQMQNKWYFQADLAKVGLILLATSSASFDQYYISKHSESNNITLYSLNTKVFINRNFKNIQTNGYNPKDGWYLWSTNGEAQPKVKDLTYLGNTIEYQQGETLGKFKTSSGNATLDLKQLASKYMENRKNWGNPFHENNINKDHRIWFTANPPIQVLGTNGLTLESNIPYSVFTQVQQDLYFKIRYNPQKDTGQDTQWYLLPNWKDESGWEPPNNEKLILTGFPSWLSVWGFTDYHKKLGEITQQETHYILTVKSKHFSPQLDYYVFLDHNFFHGDSEYLEGRTPFDELNWFPMTRYQDDSQETLAQSGPGVAKLGEDKMAECHCEYKFYFKVGGCVPPMEKVTDPTKQPTYPIPNNQLTTNSLQSPEEPIETYLYQFDERRGQITATAADRISKDFRTKKTIFSDSTTTGTDVPVLQALQEEDLTSEEEETKTETLFEQLLHQRNKQKQLRQRIKQLLMQIQTLE